MANSRRGGIGRNYLWWYIAVAGVALALYAWTTRNASSQAPMHALAGPQLLRPRVSRTLRWSRPIVVHPKTLMLPPHQLARANWWRPITLSSSVAYILHDGQARWLVQGTRIPLTTAPVDPVGNLVAAANGHMLSWTTPAGIDWMAWPGPRRGRVARASSPHFTANRLTYLLVDGSSFTVVEGSQRYHFSHLGMPFAHPFAGRGVAVYRRGTLSWVSIPGGKTHVIAVVNPRRWSTPIMAGAIRGGVFCFLSQPTAVPSYLLIAKIRGRVYDYAWQSPTVPELGVVHGTLVLTYIKSGGQLAALSHGRLTPLSARPGLFSAGSQGLVWQSHGRQFLQLAKVP